MKKTVIGITTICTLFLLTTPLVIDAATTANSGSGSSQSNQETKPSTNMVVTLQQNPETVQPVDPQKPEEPTTTIPGNGLPGKPSGPLQLVYVPRTIDFGEHKVSSVNPIHAIPVEKDNSDSGIDSIQNDLWHDKFVLEVSDARGTKAGWKLTVSGNGLSATQNENSKKSKAKSGNTTTNTVLDTIDGAKLSFGTGDISVAKHDVPANRAVSKEVINALNSDEATIINAIPQTGNGLTIDQIDRNNVSIDIPANEGQSYYYSTQLTWNLSNVPDKE